MAQLDACTLLDDDHNKVIRLFEQYKTTHNDNHKRLLASEIRQELLVHMQIEEEIFYPAFLRATGDQYRVDDSNREHQEARALIAKLEELPTDARLMLELEDAILHHVNDERDKMFPQARRTQGFDLAGLAQQLEARKAELMAPHAA
jgi:iron-sulfur cluster repair protein YtfE (RIC family)